MWVNLAVLSNFDFEVIAVTYPKHSSLIWMIRRLYDVMSLLRADFCELGYVCFTFASMLASLGVRKPLHANPPHHTTPRYTDTPSICPLNNSQFPYGDVLPHDPHSTFLFRWNLAMYCLVTCISVFLVWIVINQLKPYADRVEVRSPSFWRGCNYGRKRVALGDVTIWLMHRSFWFIQLSQCINRVNQ